MADRFEATFTSNLAPEEVWRAITRRDPKDPAKTRADEPPRGQLWLPGFEGTAELIDSVPNRNLRLRKDTMPCEGTEIAITLEADNSGTTITVAQSGFGGFFEIAHDILAIGWDLIVRDLALYIERGVIAHRHMKLWGPALGCTVKHQASGLIVGKVSPETLAAKIGLQSGDHLISIRAAPVVNERDLAMVMRALEHGDETPIAWLRGNEFMHASAVF